MRGRDEWVTGELGPGGTVTPGALTVETPDGRRVSIGLFSGEGLRVEGVLLDAGDLVRFADSMNQCLIDANWLIMGCGCRRGGRRLVNPLGDNRSGFGETSCKVLLRDLLFSFGGSGGRCLDEFADLIESFSIGGGGVADLGVLTAVPSGS